MIIDDLPMAEYHADPALSNSKAKVYADHGPQRYFRQFIARDIPGEDSDALRFGRAFDDRMFAEDFAARYVRKPAGLNLSTAEGKAWKKDHGWREIISDDEWVMMDEMAAAINANPIARALLSRGRAQVTIRNALPDLGGIVAQSRPDWFSGEACPDLTAGPYLVDLKTTTDLVQFNRNAVGLGYHRQLALGQALLARDGIRADAFLLVVEKKRAPRCRVRRMPEIALAAGWEEFRGVALSIAERMKSGDWSETQTVMEDVDIPAWDMKRLEGVA